jgi:N-acetylmuramoyl-L-alanine amidase
MNTRNWVVIHHTASIARDDRHQFDAVDRYHKDKGWGSIGYHWFLERDGTIKVGRPENATGAHTTQWLMNYRAIGVCLAGNFDQQDPSEAQWKALTALLTDIQLRNGIPDGRIKMHRHFANKTCPGTRFTEALLDKVVFPRRMRQKITVKPQKDLSPKSR